MSDMTHVEAAALTELDVFKAEMYEQSLKAGKIELLGPLGGSTPNANWTGAISLGKRLESGEITAEDVTQATEFLRRCYIATQTGARLRCIDGRLLLGYDDNDPRDYGRKLGPMVPGGTPIQAVAYRLSLGGHGDSYATINLRDDISRLAEKAVDLGYLAGDHVDDRHAAGKTGCRAIDGVEEHCERIAAPSLREIVTVSKLLLGDKYSDEDLDHVIASSVRLQSFKDKYFIEKDEILAELVAHNPEGAPTLSGVHNEIFMVINMIPGTTLHRDHFSTHYDGRIQAFNYDAWHTFDMAKALFPDNAQQQSRYVHARLALAVTALMDLTDGSLQLAVREPHSETRLAA